MEGKTIRKEPVTRKVSRPSGSPVPSRRSECRAIVFFALALFLLLCLISYDPRDPSFNVATTRNLITNVCGLIGSHVADALVQIFGLAALLIPIGLSALGLRIFIPPRAPSRWIEICSVFLLLAGIATLLERFSPGPFLKFPAQHAGGAVGAFLHQSFLRLVGNGGEIVLSLTLALVCILQLSKASLRGSIKIIVSMATVLAGFAMTIWERLKDTSAEAPYRGEEEYLHPEPPASREDRPAKKALSQPPQPPPGRVEFDITNIGIPSWERVSCLPQEDTQSAGASTPRNGNGRRKSDPAPSGATVSNPVPWKALETKNAPGGADRGRASYQVLEKAIEDYIKEELLAKGDGQSRVTDHGQERGEAGGNGRPIRVTRRADEEIARAHTHKTSSSTNDDFKLPPTDLLDPPPASTRAVDEKLLEQNAATLEQKLMDLGIKGEVVEIHPGPVITMYELTLAPGIPLRKVLGTSDDLAMALKCGSTRVVAPIPGKDTVGIEVPNLNREIVYFREIIESPAFMESSAPLKVAVGKGIDGEPFATSLTRMPHLLIAGATGTGKSVGLNVLICSWLMTCHPDDVKFLMVDPKKLELSYYQDIPHLIHPVVTEAEKVPRVLSWAIREMERRYDLLSIAGAKNIEGYNEQVRSGEIKADPEGPPAEKLPYIVIIVDELAELMMVAAKDIEISIARLAQMARASGIHLILATQRPSVDVITGVIKANFPARLSFQVSAKPDSRTILDTTGAENLLGMGDMLFMPPGTSKMRRLHGAYVSEREIKSIVDFIKAQREPVYLQEISKHVAEEESKAVAGDLIDDAKYDEAVELVTRVGHASISLIQRHMRIGYNRAARIIEAMETEGLIGPSDGTSRPREVMGRSLAHIPDTPA
jgi:S-DNA-T family DNA segregation ATPase FtsK/SpoIIIE